MSTVNTAERMVSQGFLGFRSMRQSCNWNQAGFTGSAGAFWASPRQNARCRGVSQAARAHSCPDPEGYCGCGINAYKSLFELMNSNYYKSHRHTLFLVGMWGNVVCGAFGYRAQKAKLLAACNEMGEPTKGHLGPQWDDLVWVSRPIGLISHAEKLEKEGWIFQL